MIRSGKEEFRDMSVTEQEAYIQELASVNTDWIDLLFRTAVSTNHYLHFQEEVRKIHIMYLSVIQKITVP